MRVEELLQRIRERGDHAGLVSQGRRYTYRDLDIARQWWEELLTDRKILAGSVVGLRADYSIDSVALLLALLRRRAIVALLSPAPRGEDLLEAGQVEIAFELHQGAWCWRATGRRASHPLVERLRDGGRAGLVLFTSGSTGRPKAVLHDAARFLSKFDAPLKRFTTLTFLFFDHVAGLDTLFYSLASGGTVVFPDSRELRRVCQLIQDHQVEVLPASPTFLRLLCLSGEHARFDLSSLSIITYGAEPMDPPTLEQLRAAFPAAKLLQKYGTSEFGSPRTKTRDNGSLWIKLDGPGTAIKIVDGVLWVKSDAAMLGYLNAPSPFDADGWYCTGDAVETDGEWLRVLGRQSELINVGGEKVYPAEVEAVLLEHPSVAEAVVWGEPHPLIGQIVCARLRTGPSFASGAAGMRELRRHCRRHLAPYKVPVKIELTTAPLAAVRHKKLRAKEAVV